MRCFRRLRPFRAISFDLDDTLYDNQPVIRIAEQEMLRYLQRQIPESRHLDIYYWRQFRRKAIADKPALYHDVSRLRVHALYLGITQLGYDPAPALKLAQEATDHFLLHRSNFSVPKTSTDLLAALGEHWPLVAITNGNVDIDAIGLAPYFSHRFLAGIDNRQKPDAQMFHAACDNLAIAPDDLLHVGDCPNADIHGALAAGCQVVWVNHGQSRKPITNLPHIEISDVVALHQLVY